MVLQKMGKDRDGDVLGDISGAVDIGVATLRECHSQVQNIALQYLLPDYLTNKPR